MDGDFSVIIDNRGDQPPESCSMSDREDIEGLVEECKEYDRKLRMMWSELVRLITVRVVLRDVDVKGVREDAEEKLRNHALETMRTVWKGIHACTRLNWRIFEVLAATHGVGKIARDSEGPQYLKYEVVAGGFKPAGKVPLKDEPLMKYYAMSKKAIKRMVADKAMLTSLLVQLGVPYPSTGDSTSG